MVSKRQNIVICGPTASGKSEIANKLAYELNGEVLSADSMQIYKGMDIGTGKFLPEEQSVKHWGIDIVAPDEAFSAALYQRYARDILNNTNVPIVICGGTGFYIRAALDDYDFPKLKEQDREKYQDYLYKNGKEALWELLYKRDADSAKSIHKNNYVRVIRALEMLDEGKSYANQVQNLKNIKQLYPAIFYGIYTDREVLYERINKRVDKMIDSGLVSEVEHLLNKGYRNALTAASAIGYKEIVAYLDGNQSLDEAINQIKQSSRRYAKRQMTWFRKDKRINWISFDKAQSLYQLLKSHLQ